MNRRMVNYGALPSDLDINQNMQFAMVSTGFLAEAVVGAGNWAFGLAGTQTTVPSLTVNIGRGALGQMSVVDQTNPGTSTIADSTDALMKVGINLAATQLAPFVAPSTSGQSQVFLIQGQMQEIDTGPTVIQYWNASNPSVPLSGPGGSGASNNTLRTQVVAISNVAGTPASTGSQTTPAATAGWVPLYTVTLANGQTAITTPQIVQHPAAPFLPMSLPVVGSALQDMVAAAGLTFNGADPTQPLAAVKALRTYTVTRRLIVSSGMYVPPANLVVADVEAIGGGGGGGGATGGSGTSSAAGGGGAGGYGRVWLTAAQIGPSQAVTIGSYGGGSAFGNNAGGPGGASNFGGYLTAGGGQPGTGCPAFSASAPGGGPGAGGTATSTLSNAILIPGQSGQPGVTFPGGASGIGGQGGSCPVGYGGQQGYQSDTGSAPTGGGHGAGGAGSGRATTSLGGGTGSPGLIIVTEYCTLA